MPDSITPTPVQASIEQYQQRARELRARALQTHDADSRHAYFWLATKYEFLAEALWRRRAALLEY